MTKGLTAWVTRVLLFCLVIELLIPTAGGFSRSSAADLQPDRDSLTEDKEESWIIRWAEEHTRDLPPNSVRVADYDEPPVTIARPASGIEPEAWLEEVRKSPGVQYVQPNYSYQLLREPNDPFYPNQSYLRQIEMPAAWEISQGNDELTIAIVDTGIDLTHPDLQDNITEGINLLNPSKPPQDDNGHGTSVAGVVAAVADNNKGLAGILWSAKIMPIKALDKKGFGDEDKLGEGIRYAVDHGAKIVVLSVGLYQHSQYMSEIVQYAEAKGVLLVAAAGNDGETLGDQAAVKYPAAYPTVLSVGGATDKRVEEKSNPGPELDIVAPWRVYTTALGGSYKYDEGTSMAAPQAAGVAALIWTIHPEFTPQQVRNLIRQTALDIGKKGWDPQTGFGLLQAGRALTESPVADLFENNNSREQAKPMPLKTISGELAAGADQDWFYFDAPYDGQLVLQLSAPRGSESIQLTHYKDSAAKGNAYNAAANKPVTISVEKGRNYVQLRLGNESSKTVLPYQITPEFRIGSDPFEDNDQQYKAYALPARSQTITGTFHRAGDQDWYVVAFQQKGTLSLSVEVDSVRMDPAIEWTRQGAKPQVQDKLGGGETETVTAFDVIPGKYFIRIYDASGSAVPPSGQYKLIIDYITKYTDPNEPNNKPYEAMTIRFGSEYTGVFDAKTDQDWFQFKLDGESIVRFSLEMIPNQRVMTVSLRDKRQKELAKFSNRKGQTSLQSEQVLKPDTYYILMTSDEPFDRQMYKLTVQADRLVEGFRDIANHWARDAIVELKRRNIVSGYGNYRFAPQQGITRAETAAMIVKAFGLRERAAISYTDVPKNHWAYDAISRVTAAGVAGGYGDGTFAPNRHITRAEMAAMLGNALGIRGHFSGSSPFSDVGQTHWAAPVLREMKSQGLIQGYSDGTFKPGQTASRGEFALLLYRILTREE
jgi:hypothetical protein